jgi:hypothetical protein
MPDLTVITPSMPDRGAYLAYCRASVAAQVPRLAHIWQVEAPPEGMEPDVHISMQRNALLARVTTPWVTNLDDDDWLLPNFSSVMAEVAGSADVVYTLGDTHWHVDLNGLNQAQLVDELSRHNCVPACGWVMSTEVLQAVGGWPTDWVGVRAEGGGFVREGVPHEDWALWLRLARLGATFRCVEIETWHYRRHPLQTTALFDVAGQGVMISVPGSGKRPLRF